MMCAFLAASSRRQLADHSAMHDARVFGSLGEMTTAHQLCTGRSLGRLLNVLEPENTLPDSNTNPDQRANEGNRFS